MCWLHPVDVSKGLVTLCLKALCPDHVQYLSVSRCPPKCSWGGIHPIKLQISAAKLITLGSVYNQGRETSISMVTNYLLLRRASKGGQKSHALAVLLSAH